jgi:hypothetical protein
MKPEDQPGQAAYIFSEDASYELVSRFRHSGLPPGVHFVGSVTGPWPIVAIAEFDDLAELPAIVESVFGGRSGSADPETAYTLVMNAVKHSVYTERMALVRIDVTGVTDDDGLEELQGQITEAIGSEFNFVFGAFDVFALVTEEEGNSIMSKIFKLLQTGRVSRTETLWIIDYVCGDTDAPAPYRVRTRKD